MWIIVAVYLFFRLNNLKIYLEAKEYRKDYQVTSSADCNRLSGMTLREGQVWKMAKDPVTKEISCTLEHPNKIATFSLVSQ